MDVYSTGSKTGQIAQCPFCYGIGIIYSTKILSGGSQKTQKKYVIIVMDRESV